METVAMTEKLPLTRAELWFFFVDKQNRNLRNRQLSHLWLRRVCCTPRSERLAEILSAVWWGGFAPRTSNNPCRSRARPPSANRFAGTNKRPSHDDRQISLASGRLGRWWGGWWSNRYIKISLPTDDERTKRYENKQIREKSLNTHSSADISVFRRFPSRKENEGINIPERRNVFARLFTQTKHFYFFADRINVSALEASCVFVRSRICKTKPQLLSCAVAQRGLNVVAFGEFNDEVIKNL